MTIRARVRVMFVGAVTATLLPLVACGQQPADYFPVDSGRTLQYQIIVVTPLGGSQTVNAQLTNMPSRQLNGQTVFPQKLESNGNLIFISFFRRDDTGVYEVAKQEPGDLDPKVTSPPSYVFKTPLRVGTQWTEQESIGEQNLAVKASGTCVIESLDATQTILAGTYTLSFAETLADCKINT
jgi:hypothetical protein